MIPRRMIDDVIRRNPQDPADQQQDNSTVIQPRMSPYGKNVENANNGDIGSIVPSRTPEQANALYAPQAQMGHADMGSALSRGGDISSLAPRNRMDSQTINYMQEDYNNGLKYSLPPAVAPPADRYQAEQTPVLDPHSRALAEPKGTYKAPGLKGRLWEGAKAFLMGGGVQGAMRGLFDVYGREKHDQDIAQRTEDLANQDKQLIQRNQANLGAEKFNDLQSAREQDRALQERQFQQSNENHSITERRQQQALADKEEASSIAQRQAQERIEQGAKTAKALENERGALIKATTLKDLISHSDPNDPKTQLLINEYAENAKLVTSTEGQKYLQDMLIKEDARGNMYGINKKTGGMERIGDKDFSGAIQPRMTLNVNIPGMGRGGRGGGSGPDGISDLDAKQLLSTYNQTFQVSDKKPGKYDIPVPGEKPKKVVRVGKDVEEEIRPGEDQYNTVRRLRLNGKISDDQWAVFARMHPGEAQKLSDMSVQPRQHGTFSPTFSHK